MAEEKRFGFDTLAVHASALFADRDLLRQANGFLSGYQPGRGTE